MKKSLFLLILLLFTAQQSFSQQWNAQWITDPESVSAPNTWLAFRKIIDIQDVPSAGLAKIAVDSKYWLWINGQLVVFEGGLKRGPNPQDTYYDEVDINPWLQQGRNTISILVWHFGKEGFSHKNSGKAGLLFDYETADLTIRTDKTWESQIMKEYSTAEAPIPNYRLPESSILYDARKATSWWYTNPSFKMGKAIELGKAGSAPWNQLVRRPIPLFKVGDLKNYQGKPVIKAGTTVDTLICTLPYNAQITPYMKIWSQEAGLKITLFTDNYLTYNGGATYIRSEYLTRKGDHEYESLGWVNGHQVYYIIPKGVKVLELKYRESGYDTEFSGSFSCSDPFFNKLWEKSLRTLYLNMRDTYMDCPDRERAQWTGDAVNQSGQAFYALSTSSHALSAKWLREIADWQRADGTLFAPVPSGNWNKELPDQLLATIGYYGLWNYYLNTGDRETLEYVYDPAKEYLNVWKADGKGMVEFRGGDWTWGDWGSEKDTVLIFNSFYYLALKGMQQSATALGKSADALNYYKRMYAFKKEFNARYWNGVSYRNPVYKGKTDDRVQALAVVAGLADPDKYDAILRIFKTEEHASPYMEKYVMEALFQMNEVEFALERHKKRFDRMVNHPTFTTLWEGWNFNDPTYGGGTINHSWSGGALTVLSQYLSGISPLSAAYKLFQIKPQPGPMETASASVSSVAGEIRTSFENKGDKFRMTAVVPQSTEALIVLPKSYSRLKLNGRVIFKNGSFSSKELEYTDAEPGLLKFKVGAGDWDIKATKK